MDPSGCSVKNELMQPEGSGSHCGEAGNATLVASGEKEKERRMFVFLLCFFC